MGGEGRDDSDLPHDLERDISNEVAYSFGAYTLLQLHFTSLGVSSSGSYLFADEGEIWSQWENWLFDKQNKTIDVDDVKALITDLTGSEVLYNEWVAAGRLGTPLLSLSEFNYGSGTSNSYEISQVQNIMYTKANGCVEDMDTFSNVPYYLGCYPLDNAGVDINSFDECTATRNTMLGDARPKLMAKAITEGGSLTPNASLPTGVNPMPAVAALISNNMLTELEQMPQSGSNSNATERALTWLLKCEPSSSHTWCLNDNDPPTDTADPIGDGYPATGDCNDLNAYINSGVLPDMEMDGTGTDYNCDGWRANVY
jgi:hypothetical protein